MDWCLLRQCDQAPLPSRDTWQLLLPASKHLVMAILLSDVYFLRNGHQYDACSHFFNRVSWAWITAQILPAPRAMSFKALFLENGFLCLRKKEVAPCTKLIFKIYGEPFFKLCGGNILRENHTCKRAMQFLIFHRGPEMRQKRDCTKLNSAPQR